MDEKTLANPEESEIDDEYQIGKNNIKILIKHWESKIKNIQKKILQNEVKLESMESHTDLDYKDLLRESTESKKDHKQDLKFLVDLLYKYKISIR